MPPRMNGDYYTWIVTGHNHANQIATDIAKIAGVTTVVEVSPDGV
jgi:hypothetical protein